MKKIVYLNIFFLIIFLLPSIGFSKSIPNLLGKWEGENIKSSLKKGFIRSTNIVEITEQNVYAAYEEAVLEYSYIINIHQAKNTLPNVLGNTTGTFDHHGQQLSSSPMSGTEASLRFPRFTLGYADRVGDGIGNQIGLGGNQNTYSASFDTVQDIQDYDLQSLINATSSQDATVPYFGKVDGKRVNIKRVFYKTPHAMWRFYGYYGGLNTVGNMSTYGMYSDDSSWEIIPPWQNKAQAMAYEDAIYTRNSHYSYEIKNNNLRIFPKPTTVSPSTIWVEFTIQEDAWNEETDRSSGHDGVNNMNTLPFANLPYKNINSIGWDSYPISLRIVNWIKWSMEDNNLCGKSLESLAIQARYLFNNMETHLLGNHLLANAKALIFSGSAKFPWSNYCIKHPMILLLPHHLG